MAGMKHQKIAILGFSREGKSLLRFIKKDPAYKNAEIWVLDKNPRAEISKVTKANLGENYLKNLGQFNIIFRSPGIPYNLPELVRARKNNVGFSSATKLFFEHCPTRNLIGITGTKGKGTTSTILYNILKAAHKRVFLAGNIGSPMLDLLPHLNKRSFVILELSSFQLQDLAVSPPIAAVLDVFPDHQDAHLNLKEYYEAKTNIARHQKSSDRIFFFGNHPLSRWIAAKSRGRKISVDEKIFRLFSPNNLKVPGHHNFENAMMAGTVARTLGISPISIVKAVKKFRGTEHRLEFVKKIGGADFYNDSASTIPEPTAAAILSFPGKNIILIAGGRSKVTNYSPIGKAIKRSSVKLAVLIGENKHDVKLAIKSSGVPYHLSPSLKDAVRYAYIASKKLGQCVVIFSPGSQSFDMFRNYSDRGIQFKKIIKKNNA
jgi:UDP-N-acetylmuramoylalanine--D-glutamate ligase